MLSGRSPEHTAREAAAAGSRRPLARRIAWRPRCTSGSRTRTVGLVPAAGKICFGRRNARPITASAATSQQSVAAVARDGGWRSSGQSVSARVAHGSRPSFPRGDEPSEMPVVVSDPRGRDREVPVPSAGLGRRTSRDCCRSCPVLRPGQPSRGSRARVGDPLPRAPRCSLARPERHASFGSASPSADARTKPPTRTDATAHARNARVSTRAAAWPGGRSGRSLLRRVCGR